MNNPFDVIEARLNNIETLLLDLKHNPKEHNEESSESTQWFNLPELCSYLPDKPAKPTVYGWVQNGLIPVHKGAKKLRFLKSEIDLWLKQVRKKTLAETAAEADLFLTNKKKGLNYGK